MKLVESVSYVYKDRPISNLVKWLKIEAKLRIDDIAEFLHISVPTLNCKLHRNSFTIDDLIEIANNCGYSIYINNGDAKKVCEFRTKFYDQGKEGT